ncbi:MAG: alpha/beta hydrolase [Polaromonas sp.]|nr:alpha/beta hydrolase [Polaromonas sp.]
MSPSLQNRTAGPPALALLLAAVLHAGPAPAQQDSGLARRAAKATVPAGVQQIPDIAYGDDPRQRMDVYLPAAATRTANAPVIVMVHGGAWMLGHKAMANVVNNKAAYWVREKGYVFVSVNYRLWPQADPLVQAHDVATALARAQSLAPSWGGDPAKVILMGHSAGAHLVALLGASPALAREAGAKPWLGTVALDSAALDLERIMNARHMRFYDRVFGADPAYWRSVSPGSVLAPDATPMLLVCSTQRPDDPCAQARDFAAKMTARNTRAIVLPQDLPHEQVNAALGLPGPYTQGVQRFMSEVGVL